MALETAFADRKPLFVLTGVAIVKDEASYLEEWLAYHINLGFEHFYLFDNGSSDNTPEILAPFIKYGFVTCIHWPVFPGQTDAYNYAIRMYGHTSEWMAFFDIDEFFVLKAHGTLPEFLADLQQCDQLLVFWRFFGHSGHLSRPPGLVIENYTACEDAPIFVVKSIVRPKTVITAHVHNCTTRFGLTKNDRGDHLRENWAHPPEVVSEDLIRINHYYTRSYAEYVAKIHRGLADGRPARKLEPFEKYDYRARDFQILSRVQATKDRIAAIKSLRQQPHRYGGLTNIGSISNPRNFVVFAQALAKTLAPNARPVHDIFGTVVTFDDNRDAKGLSEVFRRNAGEWARETNAAIVRAIGAGTHNMRNVNPDLGIAFEATNPNPELAIAVDDSSEGGFVWTAFLTEVPESTQIDLFALATDMHGSSLTSHRRIGMAGPGLVAGFIMINDAPCRVQSVRIRPGAAPGTYRVHCFMIFKGY